MSQHSCIKLKQNCWEYNKCGREPNGKRVKDLGICKVSTDFKSNGINNGINAGRICWTINGTLCKKVKENIKMKPKYAISSSCISCEFFKKVKREEGFGNFKTLQSETVHKLEEIIVKIDYKN